MSGPRIDPFVVLLFIAAVIAAVAALYYITGDPGFPSSDVYRPMPVSPDGTMVRDLEYTI